MNLQQCSEAIAELQAQVTELSSRLAALENEWKAKPAPADDGK